MAHIMLSYQRGHQEIVIKLRDALKSRGFTTWFDEDDMVGSVNDSMADAVENASVVIMCMSALYQTSKNCKKEIEYAQRKDKPIIPIRVEAGIKPKGWLGLSAGSMLVIDFSDPQKFNEKFKRLLKELAAKQITPKTVDTENYRDEYCDDNSEDDEEDEYLPVGAEDDDDDDLEDDD